jgi:thiamine pyrophosphate-dependent acetolactate synthase large subunit-like protein
VGQLPPTALQPEIAYDALAVSLGGEGIRVTTGHELKTAVIRGIAAQKRGTVTLVNVLMDSGMKKESVLGV